MDKKLTSLIDKMYNARTIILPVENDYSTHYLQKKGGAKLAKAGWAWPKHDNEVMAFLEKAIAEGVICANDIHLKLIDMPKASNIPETREDIMNLYADMVINSGEKSDVICSLAYAGIGAGTLTAHKLKLPHSIFRKEQSETDKRLSVITGYPIEQGDSVALCDDAIRAGHTAVESAGYLRTHGVTVDTIYSFLRYLGNGKENCDQNDLSAHTLITEPQLAKWVLDNRAADLTAYAKKRLSRSAEQEMPF